MYFNHLAVQTPANSGSRVRAHEQVEPIFKMHLLHELENQQLAQLRDWLLPMLMNGQVTVA